MGNRTNRVIVVGAGLSGLACALYLTAAGREVTVIDRHTTPGGRHSCLEIDGFRFDTGPVTPLAPHDIAAPLRAAGESLQDWLDLVPLDPICRAHYPDGTTLDVHPDPFRTAAAIGALCGGAEARAFMRFLKAKPFRVPAKVFLNDPRTLRLFGSASLFGFTLPDMGWHPRGGTEAVPRALATAAEKLGVSLRLATAIRRWETRGSKVLAVHTDEGERLTADAFVFPGTASARTPRGPSHLAIHLGTRATYTKIAHHNIHFGKPWQRSRHEILRRGELMSDPSIIVSAPGQTDATGQNYYRIIVPVPNLSNAPLDWTGPATRAYAGEILATLEARGYLDLTAGPTTTYMITPADWARQGMPYGISTALTRRPTKLHSSLSNVVIAGAGLSAGRTAAEKVVSL